MELTTVRYTDLTDSVIDELDDWQGNRLTFASAVIELGQDNDTVAMLRDDNTLVGIALLTPVDNTMVVQFLATKCHGWGKRFIRETLKHFDSLALHSMQDARGFYEDCGFTPLGNGNYYIGKPAHN